MNEGQENYRFNIWMRDAKGKKTLGIGNKPGCLPFPLPITISSPTLPPIDTLSGNGAVQKKVKLELVKEPNHFPKKQELGGGGGRDLLQEAAASSEQLEAMAMARDQCIQLQELVRTLSKDMHSGMIGTLVRNLYNNFGKISCSTYGNFLVQIIIAKSSALQRQRLLAHCRHDLVDVACDATGIFSIQKLVDCMESQQEVDLLSEIVLQDVVKLMKSSSGGFLVKKLIALQTRDFALRMLHVAASHWRDIACNKYGICSIKHLINTFANDRAGFGLLCGLFLQNMSKCMTNSHFHFGIHHLLLVVNQQQWTVSSFEQLLTTFFQFEVKGRIRSRSIALTVLLATTYHNKVFVQRVVLAGARKLFPAPLSTADYELIASLRSQCNPLLLEKLLQLLSIHNSTYQK